MRRILLLLAAGAVFAPAAFADDAAELRGMLADFLANVSERSAHERFWAEDLVYTSSTGARFGKSDILAGVDDAADARVQPVYAAEDVDVRLHDDMAVVAFRLVAAAADGSSETYSNTGTFARRDGRWEVVAWQATKITPGDP